MAKPISGKNYCTLGNKQYEYLVQNEAFTGEEYVLYLCTGIFAKVKIGRIYSIEEIPGRIAMQLEIKV